MRIYTAATFTEQQRIRQHKEQLIQLGHTVVSSWLEEQVHPDGMSEEIFERKNGYEGFTRGSQCRLSYT